MQKTKSLPFAAVASALVLFSACSRHDNNESDSPGQSPAKTIRLTYSVFFPPTHFNAILASEWAKDIEKRTDNAVKIDIFAAGSLTKPDLCYQGVVDGVSDIGMSCLAYTRGRFPVLEGLDLPVGYPDGKTATRVANQLLAKYRDDLKEIGETHFLYLHAHGPGVLASKKPIQSLDGMKGLKTRATGLSAAIVTALGGNPVAMSQAETYDALQKGVVEATLCPIETLEGWRQGEVIASVTEVPAIGYTTAMFVTINKKTWAKLPENVRKVITEVSAEYVEKHAQAWDVADDKGRDLVTRLGHTIITLSPEENIEWAEKTRPILDDYVSKTEEKGLPGKRFLEDLQSALRR